MWEPTPIGTTQRGTDTAVSFRLRYGRSREQALRTPHTFRLESGGTVVANRNPDEVRVESGSMVGTWIVTPLAWRTMPTTVQRRDYSTLLVTFEPDERRGYPRSPSMLQELRHTFTVDGVTVTDRKPDRVSTERNGRSCPCYGLWIVTKPLTQPSWSATPLAPPRRSGGQVTVEYEFFAPSGGPQAWDAVARDTAHTVAPGRTQRADAVDVTNTGRIVGRWTLPASAVEGYETSSDCMLGPHFHWIMFLLVVALIVWLAHCERR